MKRFIRYLYEYENEKRIRNVGFIKVETGCEETIVHMQAKGFYSSEDRKLVLYLFYVENEKIVGIPQGELNLISPALSWHLTFVADKVVNYNKISGVLIETASGKRLAATWDDQVVDVSKLSMFSPLGEEKDSVEECDATEDDGSAQCQTGQQQIGKKLTKISCQDISRFPRCEWKLANNPFLVYGYNNFHYLLLIDDGNYLKLGVPGIYHTKEAKCAERFGFEEFLSADELGMIMEDDYQEDELFGYWCRPVRRGRNQ